MTFLSDLIAKVIEFLVAKFIVEKTEQVQIDARLAEQGKADAEALANAKTKEEKDAALKSANRHTFN